MAVNSLAINKLGLLPSAAIYSGAALLMYVQTQFTIPYLTKITGQEPILFWFIVGGLGIFLPLIITGLLILRHEGFKLNKETFVERLRFKKISYSDIILSFLGLIMVGVLSVLIMKGLELIIGKFETSPPFMTFEPLSQGRYWLLLVWLPYWLLNILGEEFLWRGIMLPRQEVVFGKYTWLLHGFGWMLFHLAFGWKLVITLLPLLFIQSYLVQKTKNTWVGVIMHATINGPSFIAICFGLI